MKINPKTSPPVPPDQAHLAGLTTKQRRFVKAMVYETDVASQAVKIAGYNTEKPEIQANDNLRKPNVREAIQLEMERAGVNKNKLVGVLSEGLSAVKPKDTLNENFPDHQARTKYLDMGLKLLDAYPDNRPKIDNRTANINYFSNMTPQQRKKALEKLNKEIGDLQ